jgi:hypothetical protein
MNEFIIICDWLGSLIMLGTVWGWVYNKISPKINELLTKTDYQVRVLSRLISIKEAGLKNNSEAYRLYVSHEKRIGLNLSSSPLWRFSIIREEKRIIRRLKKYGLLTEEESERLNKIRKGREASVMLILKYLCAMIDRALKKITAKIIDKITTSIFTGKISFLLFGIGFFLWNLSKILAIYNLRAVGNI